MNDKTIGIIGAGKLGTVLAQLALKAGYQVYISGSGDEKKTRLVINTLAPGAVAATNKEVAKASQIIILALPLSTFRKIEKATFNGKIVIDATNYWWEIDGPRSEILPNDQSSSEAVQEYFSGASVVKALSHMGYHHLYDEARPVGAVGRKAIAVAGNDKKSIATAEKIISDFGFDPVFIGLLAEGRRLEPGMPAFGANETATRLLKTIAS